MNFSTANLFIIIAPSGTGKTSLVNALLDRMPELKLSISHTTREKRKGEVDGKHYHFVDLAQFNQMKEEGQFIETAKVFDNFYGTSKLEVQEKLNKGQDVILEIDWQGALQVKKIFNDAVCIFILPPSKEALETRLKGRGKDTEVVIQKRLDGAKEEISHYDAFDYLLVNDKFSQAVDDLMSVVRATQLNKVRQKTKISPLIEKLLASSSD